MRHLFKIFKVDDVPKDNPSREKLNYLKLSLRCRKIPLMSE